LTGVEKIKEIQKILGVVPDGKWGKKSQAALDEARSLTKVVDVPASVPSGMGVWSKRSSDNLAECHPDLQRLAAAIDKRIDIEVICGHRGEKEQNEAVRNGTSKLPWPKSKHNSNPSHAFDACPNPIDWKNRDAFLRMRAIALEEAQKLGIKIRLISWDLPHVELA
jgi:hypothetical protein